MQFFNCFYLLKNLYENYVPTLKCYIKIIFKFDLLSKEGDGEKDSSGSFLPPNFGYY